MEPHADREPDAVTITVAGADDAETAVLLYGWLFEPPGARPARWSDRDAVAALLRVISSPASVVLIARQRLEPVGLCTVYLDIESVRFGRRAWVEDLAVHPRHRSRGIGRLLLERAKSWARDHGASHLELESSEARSDAHRFYDRERPTWRSACYCWEL